MNIIMFILPKSFRFKILNIFIARPTASQLSAKFQLQMISHIPKVLVWSLSRPLFDNLMQCSLAAAHVAYIFIQNLKNHSHRLTKSRSKVYALAEFSCAWCGKFVGVQECTCVSANNLEIQFTAIASFRPICHS